MALENSNKAVYLSIGDGKITKRVKQPTTTSVTRQTKEGKIIHEEVYDAVSGHITDIRVQDHPTYGKFWNVVLQDGEDQYILQMNYSGGYASAFLKTLPNADLSKPVRIVPSLKMEGDKKKVTLFINQGGNALKHFYTKDNPNGLPKLAKVKIKGKETWDDSDMMEFLENMVTTTILPKLKAASKPAPAAAIPAGTQEDDDIPF